MSVTHSCPRAGCLVQQKGHHLRGSHPSKSSQSLQGILDSILDGYDGSTFRPATEPRRSFQQGQGLEVGI